MGSQIRKRGVAIAFNVVKCGKLPFGVITYLFKPSKGLEKLFIVYLYVAVNLGDYYIRP